MADYEPLTPAHFEQWDEAHYLWAQDVEAGQLVGYALRDNGKIICLGGIYTSPHDGRLWAIFGSRKPPPFSVHRMAVKIVAAARQSGANAIWAELDESKPRARAWLERFGFVETTERVGALPRWRLDFGRPGDNDCACRLNSHDGLRPSERGCIRQGSRQV